MPSLEESDRSGQARYDARNPRYPGLKGVSLVVDFGALVHQKDDVIAGYRQRKYESPVGGKFRIEKGHARFLDPKTVDVDGKRLSGEAILIATGSRPAIPNIESLSEVPYLTSDLLTSGESVELRDLPRSLLILGGGYIALELGQMFKRFGTEVTIRERGEEILAHGYEPEVGPTVRKIFEEEGITVLTRATARALRKDGEMVSTGYPAVVQSRNRRTNSCRTSSGIFSTGNCPKARTVFFIWLRYSRQWRHIPMCIWKRRRSQSVSRPSRYSVMISVTDRQLSIRSSLPRISRGRDAIGNDLGAARPAD